MTVRCKSCSRYGAFGQRGERLADKRCTCGGKFEMVHHIGNGLYKNFQGDIFDLVVPYFVDRVRV